MSEVAEIVGLSTIDIKALRQADRWCFSYSSGESNIRCIKDVKNHGPFDDREREHTIACESRFYGENSSEVRHCFSLVYNYTHSIDRASMSSVLLLIRPGDELRLSWSIDNSNGYLRDTEKQQRLYRDELWVAIIRKGKMICSVHVDSCLCPNNSARMIRFG